MNAQDELQMLQFEQLDHDKLFHPDIMCLPVQKRACHMTLHFAKYAGKLTEAKQSQDRELLKATLIDSFIIFLASSNIFNRNVSDFPCISDYVIDTDINNLAKKLKTSSEAHSRDIFSFANENISIESGRLAKTIESLDHLENYDYVEKILGSLNKILETVLVTALFLNLDLASETRVRLAAVEKKSIFYCKHRGPSNTNLGSQSN